MNREQTEKLWNAFPNLYCDKDAPITESLVAFGFECGSGWFDLIWDMSEKLEKMIVEYKEKHPDAYAPRAVQVKEKFGTLRFYMHNSTDEMEKLIEEAEARSEVTCETCGKPGKLHTGGWWYVSCEEHESKK